MRQDLLVSPPHVLRLYPPRTSGINPQVGSYLFLFDGCRNIPENLFFHRIYAVTMKNVPIVVCFAVITVSQFVLGVWMLVLAALRGGKGLAFETTSYSHPL